LPSADRSDAKNAPSIAPGDGGGKVADAIVKHLESNNWKIEQGPPIEGHGQ
jgi:hypothetical protein